MEGFTESEGIPGETTFPNEVAVPLSATLVSGDVMFNST
jgi:hypothetical protein